MNKIGKLIFILLLSTSSGVLISLSVLFYNEGETGKHYNIYPPLGGIGIIIGIIAIVLIIRFIFSSSNSSSTHETEYDESSVDLDPKYTTKLDEKKTYQLSIGYTDRKEDKCIDAMKKYGWTLVRKNEFNLTLYFERETESLEIEKMLLPIAIRMNNDDDRFLEERKNHIYASMELAKRLYNQKPSEIDTARYAGSLLASAMSTDDFPFKDLYEEAQEQVRTRVEKKNIYTSSTSYSSSDYSYSSDDYDSYDSLEEPTTKGRSSIELRDGSGSSYGTTLENGRITDASGNTHYWVDEDDGRITNASGDLKGYIKDDGTITDMHGFTKGRITEDGRVVDNVGNTIANNVADLDEAIENLNKS